MAEAYYEGGTIIVTDANSSTSVGDDKYRQKTLFFTHFYSGPATVEFIKNDTQVLDTKSATIKTGKLSSTITYVLPVVGDTDPSYELKVKLKYKTTEKLLLVVTVWPRVAKATFVDKDDNALPHFSYEVEQEGTRQVLNSDSKGVGVILLKKAAYTISPAGKYVVESLTPVSVGKLRNDKIKVKDAITAKFLKPDITDAAYLDDADAAPAKKQWVNLKSAVTTRAAGQGGDAKGNEVTFSVTATNDAEARPGAKVYFEVKLGRESKRDNPLPVVTSAYTIFTKKVNDKTTTGYVLLDNSAKPTGYFQVNLGIAGGDTCEVKIGGTPAVADATLKLINWRKLYAQITRATMTPKPSLAIAQGCLKKVYVDLEESSQHEVLLSAAAGAAAPAVGAPVAPHVVAPAGSIVNGAEIKSGAAAQSLVVGDHNINHFSGLLKPYFAANSLPVAHIIYCDFQLDALGCQASGTISVAGNAAGSVQNTVAFPGGGNVPGVRIPGNAFHASGLLFAKDVTDGTDAVKACTWAEVGTAATGTISAGDYKIDQVAHGNFLFIRLPAAAKALSDAGSEIEVSVTVAYAKGWYNGWCTSGGRHNVIATGRPDRGICGTIVHEIGHAIFQAPKAGATEFPGLPAPPHERFYTNSRGHQGPHCADGLSAANYNNAAFMMNDGAAGAVCTCIMFGAGEDVRNNTMSFCPKCSPYVKAAPLSTVST